MPTVKIALDFDTAKRRAGPPSVLRTLGQMAQARRERRHLGQLSDHLLEDLGLDREQALREARRPFWDFDPR